MLWLNKIDGTKIKRATIKRYFGFIFYLS